MIHVYTVKVGIKEDQAVAIESHLEAPLLIIVGHV
jgi:hypothetical protein